MSESNIDSIDICRALYPASEAFWREIRLQPKFGFKILNGPPIKNAPFLFIGYQPGGDAKEWEEEKAKGTHIEWPLVCEYATANWRLAQRLRRIFSVEVLKSCVGTNAIFLRYKNDKQYRIDVGADRDAIENFCKKSILKIVQAIQPQQIVTIGFRTLEMFGSTTTELMGEKRVLIKKGNVYGQTAVGLIHLTGARPSDADLDAISNYFNSARFYGCGGTITIE